MGYIKVGGKTNKHFTMTEKIITNPISTTIKNSVERARNKILFAVPFMTDFALRIFNENNTGTILEKKCVVRFDDSNLVSFDIPTLQKLLDFGFEIRFDNKIHLKLYVTDFEAYVTSSNLTLSGFENNIELTVKVEQENINDCLNVFNAVWNNAANNKITNEVLEANLAKYYVLKRLSKETNNINLPLEEGNNFLIEDNCKNLINKVFASDRNYSALMKLAYEAKQIRNDKIAILKNGYRSDVFYVKKNQPNRNTTLYYDFIHGHESKLAGTGLRDQHFEDTYTNPEFKQVFEYIMPESVGLKKWNFNDKIELQKFCYGLFDFKIKSYTETLPIRLASYFYPDFFLPIFKLEHLSMHSRNLGYETVSKGKGQRLYDYNTFLFSILNNCSYDTYIKSNILYLIHYTLELDQRLQNGENYQIIHDSYSKKWEKNFIEEAFGILNTES